ncbi:MAG: 3-phosphoshikimate 1-carboxyvinyltransferase, partial [Candidatus Omnitrophica bacterium]|nr:3-phosphoshikimate 1-carboxyvinyltransferase [Candidatus Omnitrophota bacterium]
MEELTIRPVPRLKGDLVLPGDKSISHRAVMIGAIAKGKTIAKDILDCDDCNYTIRAFADMGIVIKKESRYTTIEGKGLRGLARPKASLNVGNSGTSMRLLAGILAGQDFSATLEGDESLSARPMKRISEPLALMGVSVNTRDGHPPLEIRGGNVKAVDYVLPIPSAQIKSALLFAGLYAAGVTTVRESSKSRDHTERMLEYFGADIKVEGLNVSVKGGRELAGRELEVPGDISSASFFMAGAILLDGSKVRIKNVSINPTRAGVLDILTKMGAKIKIVNKTGLFEPAGDIEVESGPLRGVSIGEGEIPAAIDELPIIFVLACLAKGRTVIKGAGELRVKETDRIRS